MASMSQPNLLPTVAVVVPVHNAMDFLADLRAGLTSIAGDAAQIVIVDDHSEDGTLDEVMSWDLGTELTVTRSPERGVAAARNHALTLVTTECVWLVDSDDAWSPQAISIMAAAMTDDVDLVLCSARRVYPDGAEGRPVADGGGSSVEMTGSEALRRVLTGEVEGHLWNKLFRTSLFEHVRFPPTNAHSDLGGVLRLLGRARRVRTVPDVLYSYMMRSGSILHKKKYSWTDLPTCLAIAEDLVSQSGDLALRAAMRSFTARSIVVPLQIETIRRESIESERMIREVRRANRRRISVRAAVGLIRHQQRLLGVQLLAIRFVPSMYQKVYSRRSKKIAISANSVSEIEGAQSGFVRRRRASAWTSYTIRRRDRGSQLAADLSPASADAGTAIHNVGHSHLRGVLERRRAGQ